MDAATPNVNSAKAPTVLRVGSAFLALVLAIVAIVVVVVMLDIPGSRCSDAAPGEGCYDISSSAEPVVLIAGWIGGIGALVAAGLAVAFTARGRGGRPVLFATAASVVLLVISVIAARL